MSAKIKNGDIYAWDFKRKRTPRLKARKPVALPPHAATIMVAVCEELACSKEDVVGTGKHRRFVNARRVFSYLVRRRIGYTLTEIGMLLNKDHSVIGLQIAQMEDFIFVKDPITKSLERIENKLNQQSI